VFVNRSVSGLVSPEGGPVLAGHPFSPAARAGLDTVTAELRSRVRLEAQLRAGLEGLTSLGVFSLPEQVVVSGDTKPVEVVRGLARNLTAQLRRLP